MSDALGCSLSPGRHNARHGSSCSYLFRGVPAERKRDGLQFPRGGPSISAPHTTTSLTITRTDVKQMEGLLPKLYGDDAVEIPGARPLLQDLIAQSAPWTIVTSGTVPLVTGVCSPFNPPHP